MLSGVPTAAGNALGVRQGKKFLVISKPLFFCRFSSKAIVFLNNSSMMFIVFLQCQETTRTLKFSDGCYLPLS